MRPASDSGASPKTWSEITRLLALFEDAARALHTAHEAGVIHRDIKPGNLMVTESGNSVILDFGLAQEIDGDQPTLTLTGNMMGTPAYMSPEQIAAHRIRLDRRTDIYSLGVSLYESLTLRRPFDALTRDGLCQAILTKTPPDLREQNPALPADLKVVLDTALEKDRDRRYQTALNFAEELRRVRLHEPILSKPVGPLVRLQRWAQRNPALAAAGAGLFAALAIGLAVSLFLLDQRNRALAEVTTERDAKHTALNEKQAALSDYDRLGDSSRLQRLRVEAEDLWPSEPSRVPAMKAWLDQAADLEKRLPGHRELLSRLDNPTARPADYVESSAAQFKQETTAKLVADLIGFLDPDPSKGLFADVRRRLTFAESVERETITRYERTWSEAIRSIANRAESPTYDGLEIKPQLGLIPIGKDPGSGLWEFAHLQTSAPGADPIPMRAANGRLEVTEPMGLVFVLLPGGTFRMGAIKPNEDQAPTEPNVDPEAHENVSPVTEVRLEPFLMSKYEMTQGQWVRMAGRNPSSYRPGTRFGSVTDLSSPVEHVSWDDCQLWMERLGLRLPTEAQWEYGARGGTTTPRWTGIGTEELGKAANLADAFCQQYGGPPSWKYEAWSDGYTITAPAGSFAPNPFGLYDVLGNVWEWCRDYGSYEVPPRAEDGLRSPFIKDLRVSRGGAWSTGASYALSAVRGVQTREERNDYTGVRPIKTLER